jgi:2-polyprenyl-3-methyl-5-hydroxy-6-metoxy-1,4-benzoquinol methylase
MNLETRNLNDYVEQYISLPFEHLQIEFRRKLVLSQIHRLGPRRLLEVGCGVRPLFLDLPVEMEITVVEPAQVFAEHARQLSAGLSNVHILQDFIESEDLVRSKFDMIILSCVLHEVPDSLAMLEAIKLHCTSTTTLHVNVPNANSLHRLLAVAMGLIPSPSHKSNMQEIMQQRKTIYDFQSLKAELSSSGFDIVDEGSIFVKPFTHSQMQQLVDNGFMTSEMLDGLDKLVDWLPDLGSEIWVNARRA